MFPFRFHVLSIALALGLVQYASAATACPGRPVTLVVPYGAGGTTDVLARALADRLAKSWGASVVVENRSGANGIIATVSVARAAADGQTILMHLTGLIQNVSLYKRLPYDPFTDLVAVTRIGTQPMALAVNPRSPSTDLRSLVRLLSSQPEVGTYGSFGVGSTGHIYGEMLRKAASSTMAHAPYRGEALMLPDLAAGRIDLGFVSAATAIERSKDGTLRILGVTGTHRLAALPHVPTLAEAGLEGFELVGWYGLFVPNGTPAATIECIAASTEAALAHPEMTQRLRQLAVETRIAGPDQFRRALREDFRRWDGLIKRFGITLDWNQ